MEKIQIERALRVSGVLLILGIVVEIVSLLWEKPLAFLLFAGVGGSFTFLGIILYLFSLLPSASENTRSSGPPTNS
jgi:hypothetical protein